jgi:unsaturated rhamnogalacturonyl hydrolase
MTHIIKQLIRDMKEIILILSISVFTLFTASGQEKKLPITDVNTPLHLLQPDYPVPYGPVKTEDIKEVLNRIYLFLEASSPAKMTDSKTKAEITDLKQLTQSSVFEPGVFRLISYEWGVAYGAMLHASEATGDRRFSGYTVKRMNLIANVASYFKSLPAEALKDNNPVRSVLEPRALDDAGSMCAAMIKSLDEGSDKKIRSFIDNYIGYISKNQFRLNDGTLARNRPLPNTLWLDDLYMSVPALAQAGRLTGDKNYYDDAVKQVLQFSVRMFNKDKNLFMHGWVEGMEPHPEFYWGRCNGWAMLAITELLDVLPENHEKRGEILNILRSHIKGIASLQSGNGFWHQLLDRNDSYFETSCTAIFTYCISHAINKGWIDARSYGPAAVLGWNAVSTRVNTKGEVEGTCVGTGMAFDPAFYYNRPVNVAAAHGYGPVILAGSEIIMLMKNYQVVINDAAVMFYPVGTDWKNYR